MTDQHPITPPPELVKKWLGEQYGVATAPGEATLHIATQAARWGADQELEACCEWAASRRRGLDDELRTARRPKLSNLKEQALLAIDAAVADDRLSAVVADIVRRALE